MVGLDGGEGDGVVVVGLPREEGVLIGHLDGPRQVQRHPDVPFEQLAPGIVLNNAMRMRGDSWQHG